jgi:hypothetical protein
MFLLSLKAGLRGKEIPLTWSMVTDAEGEMAKQ